MFNRCAASYYPDVSRSVAPLRISV